MAAIPIAIAMYTATEDNDIPFQ